MKVIITIERDNEAVNGEDCGNELARILRVLPDHFEFESKSTITKRNGGKPKRLRDNNGQTVGLLELTGVVDGEKKNS
jgi:hypothetical protein